MALFEIINGEAVIPYGTRVLHSGAFCDCNELEKVVIPDTVLKIETRAFYNCPNLKEIFIPCTVSVIEVGAFGYCPIVESIVVDEENPRYDSREACNAIIITEKNSILFGCRNTLDNIPISVKRIEKEAFAGGSCTHKLILPRNIKNIGVGAFRDVQGLGVAIIDSSSIKAIPERTFARCSHLWEIYFWGDNVTKIDESAFDGVDLKNIKVPHGKVEQYREVLPERFLNTITEEPALNN